MTHPNPQRLLEGWPPSVHVRGPLVQGSRFSRKDSVATSPLLPACPPDLQPTEEFHDCRGFWGGSQPLVLPRPGDRGIDDAKWAAGRLACHVPGRGGAAPESTRPLTPAQLAETRPLLTLAAQVPDQLDLPQTVRISSQHLKAGTPAGPRPPSS